MSWGSSYAWLLRDFIRDEINSVCPSVCLSHWLSVLKRHKIGSRFLFHMIALFRHYATISVCVGNDAFWFRLLFTVIYPEYTKCELLSMVVLFFTDCVLSSWCDLCRPGTEYRHFMQLTLRSKRVTSWDRLCRDVVGWLVVGWSSRTCTVARQCILGL